MTTNPNIYGNKTKFIFNKRVKLNRTDETLLRLREDIQKINDLNLDISREIVGEDDIFQNYQTLPNFHIMNLKMLLICHFLMLFDEDEIKQKMIEYESDIFKIFGASSLEEKSKIKEDIAIYITYITKFKDQDSDSSSDEEEEEYLSINEDVLNNISSVWQNSNYQKPSKIITIDKDNNIFFNVKIKTDIVSVMSKEDKNKVSIYMIPKKYLSSINENMFLINDSSKLSLINCNGNPIDNYDKFVIKNIMPIYFNN